MDILDFFFAALVFIVFFIGTNPARISHFPYNLRYINWISLVVFLAFLKFIDIRLKGAHPTIENIWLAIDALLGVFILVLPIIAIVFGVYMIIIQSIRHTNFGIPENRGLILILYGFSAVVMLLILTTSPMKVIMNWWQTIIFGSVYQQPFATAFYENLKSGITSVISDDFISTLSASVVLFASIVTAIKGTIEIIEWFRSHPVIKRA